MKIKDKISGERLVLEQIKATLSVYQTVLAHSPGQRKRNLVAYASSPITTGQQLYEVMRRESVSTVDQLKKQSPQIFGKEVFNSNLMNGQRFGMTLRKRFPVVIVPGEFFAKGWLQEHYMAFWDQVISQYVSAVCFNEGWEYSSGCAMEYFIGLREEKVLLDHTNVRLPPERAADHLSRAIDDIVSWGFDPTPIFSVYRSIALRHEVRSAQTT